MPMHPTSLYLLRTVKQQSRKAYLLIPMLLYLVLLIVYPTFERDVLGHQKVNCSEKTALVELDEDIFQHIYKVIRGSENKVLLCFLAVPYLVHFGSSAVYILYLLFKRPGWRYFWLYGLSLGLTSAFSIILQYVFPTAPPWIFADLPAEAKFYRVDEVLSITLFHNIYGLNKLVCGAFPSIHVQWPTVIAMGEVVSPWFGASYVLWIVTAAIYSEHHWISDVLAGLSIAITASMLAKYIIRRLVFEETKYEKQEEIPLEDIAKSATALRKQNNV